MICSDLLSSSAEAVDALGMLNKSNTVSTPTHTAYERCATAALT